MSTSGKIFEERVFSVSSDSAGSRAIDFVVENDGCIITIERLSGAATIVGSFKSNLPTPMSEILLESFTVSNNTPVQFAHIVGAQARIEVSWDDAAEFRITAKQATGSAVSAINPAIIILDTFDGFVTQKVSVTTTVFQIVNTANRKAIGIRNWADRSSSVILYVKENNVTVTDGWPLAAGEGLSLDIDANSSVYLVASSGTIDTRLLEVTNIN